MFGYFHSCLMIKFKRTYCPFYIICMNLQCRLRIYFRQHCMQVFCPFFLCENLQFFPIIIWRIIFRKINIIKNRLDIKTGSSYNQRNFSLFINLFHFLKSHLLKTNNIKFLFRLENINQVMRNPAHFTARNLCRTDIHMFIYLHRICRNNFCPYSFCKPYRCFCFSDRCRSGQNNQWFFHLYNPLKLLL